MTAASRFLDIPCLVDYLVDVVDKRTPATLTRTAECFHDIASRRLYEHIEVGDLAKIFYGAIDVGSINDEMEIFSRAAKRALQVQPHFVHFVHPYSVPPYSVPPYYIQPYTLRQYSVRSHPFHPSSVQGYVQAYRIQPYPVQPYYVERYIQPYSTFVNAHVFKPSSRKLANLKSCQSLSIQLENHDQELCKAICHKVDLRDIFPNLALLTLRTSGHGDGARFAWHCNLFKHLDAQHLILRLASSEDLRNMAALLRTRTRRPFPRDQTTLLIENIDHILDLMSISENNPKYVNAMHGISPRRSKFLRIALGKSILSLAELEPRCSVCNPWLKANMAEMRENPVSWRLRSSKKNHQIGTRDPDAFEWVGAPCVDCWDKYVNGNLKDIELDIAKLWAGDHTEDEVNVTQPSLPRILTFRDLASFFAPDSYLTGDVVSGVKAWIRLTGRLLVCGVLQPSMKEDDDESGEERECDDWDEGEDDLDTSGIIASMKRFQTV